MDGRHATRVSPTPACLKPVLAPPVRNLAREVIEAYGNDTMAHPIGTGPYMLKEWTRRARIVLEANPDYRGIPWNFAAGTSYALTPHMTMDLAASYDKIKSEPIDKTEAAYVGTPLQTIIQNDGYLHNASALIFSAGGSFTF